MKKLPLYEITLSDVSIDGIVAMSLVDEPAIEIDFMFFSKEKIDFKVTNEEERIVMGPAIISGKKIYRKDPNGYEYDVVFNKDVVKQIAHSFLLNNKQNNVTLQHQVNGNGVKMVETWLSKVDNEMGFETHIGDWFVAYKIEDDEIWEGVKAGHFNGFSVEIFSTLKEMFSKEDEEDFLEKEIDDMNEEELRKLVSKIGEEPNKK